MNFLKVIFYMDNIFILFEV